MKQTFANTYKLLKHLPTLKLDDLHPEKPWKWFSNAMVIQQQRRINIQL